jgi:uncharacterized protein (DUF1501 family)
MTNKIERRDFVKGLFALPAFAVLGGRANVFAGDAQAARSLVVVHLAGGNDGLNTVVPVADPAYRRLRPALALSGGETLAIDRGLALHGALSGFKKLYEAGQLAIVQGVGYPSPDFSHFRATEIWEAGDPGGGASGWIGRYLDETRERRGLRAVALSREQPPLALASSSTPPVTIGDPDDFRPPASADRIRAMYAAYAREASARREVGEAGLETLEAAAKISGLGGGSGGGYPPGGLGADLRRTAELLASGVGVEVVHLSFGGFDTHVNQPGKHRQLLAQLGNAFAAFQQDLARRGLSKRVASLVFSEFGRRPAENFGGGTDHGSAGPVFVIADGVRGGLHGDHPSLTNLDNGNLVFTTDFRSVYAAVVRDCLKADPTRVVGGATPLALF